MEFLVTFKPQDISCSSLGFKRTQINKLTFLTENLSAPELSKLSEAYHGDRLFQEIKQITKNNFLLVLIDDQNEKLLIFNDHFATNEILYMRVEGTLLVSNRARLIFESIGRGPTLDEDAIYEFFHFFYISPPRSIYKGVKSLPAASCLVADARELSEGVTVKSYWSFEQECRPKIRKYDELVEGLREALFECIKQDLDEELAVSLSGGIDSGGVLALIGELEGKPVRSITIGPYGERSADLFSSRQTASELGSINTEIYPLKTDLLKLKECLQDVNQPLNGPVALSACLIFDKAKTLGVKQIYTGFGSGMMLGTQKENRLAYYLDKVEWLIPPVLRKHSRRRPWERHEKIYTGFGSGMMLGTQKENRLAYYLDKVEWLIPPVLRKHSYSTFSFPTPGHSAIQNDQPDVRILRYQARHSPFRLLGTAP